MRQVIAEILWFNAAKGYGWARPDDFSLEDIKFETSTVDKPEVLGRDLRGYKAEVTFREGPIGLVADRVKIIRMAANKHKIIEFAKRMPKVELLVHLDGAVSLPTLFAIAQRNNYALGVQSADELRQFTYNFGRFIQMYRKWSNALQTPEDYAQITYEYLHAAHSENIRYVEACFSPYTRKLSLEQMFEGILAEGPGPSRI
jgi:hypothetical protein